MTVLWASPSWSIHLAHLASPLTVTSLSLASALVAFRAKTKAAPAIIADILFMEFPVVNFVHTFGRNLARQFQSRSTRKKIRSANFIIDKRSAATRNFLGSNR